jgi:hypothetical protein
MRTLFEALYIEHGTIKTITPTVIYLPLIGAMRELMQFPEYGVADGLPVPVTEDWRALPLVVEHKQAYTFVRP